MTEPRTPGLPYPTVLDAVRVTALGKRLFGNVDLQNAIDALVDQVVDAGSELRPTGPTDAATGVDVTESLTALRGRPLFFESLIGSGLGRGALVECLDGAVRYDFITGIGVHFGGHSNRELMRVAVRAALQDTIQQGNLHMNVETEELMRTLVDAAPERIEHVWLATSGADANENALKVARAARHPAYMVVAFQNCFAGRTTTMAEITDNEAYRQGQVIHGDVLYVPFYDAADPNSIGKTVEALEAHIAAHPGKIAVFMAELVQGEGGFNGAPPTFFEAIAEVCKKNDILFWVDEVQTFGRTTELYATTALGLDEHVDLITVGKMLQGAATLYTADLNPAPGLLSGTFVGTTVALATGNYLLRHMLEGGFYGPEGRIAEIESLALSTIADLTEDKCEGAIGAFGAVGSMVWIQPFDGAKDKVLDVVRRAYDHGVITFYTGRGPFRLRLLLPAAVITDEEIVDGLNRIGDAIGDVAN